MFGQYVLGNVVGNGEYHAPKLSHKKSRYGCQRCRARRVKCDEAKPICAHCERLRTPCLYDREPKRKNAQTDDHGVIVPSPESEGPSPPSLDRLGEESFPESRERRLLESRLMHQYVTITGPRVGIDERTQPVFAILVPKYSLESEAVIKYLALGLREHKKEVSELAKSNVEWICLTSHLLRICSFATLQIRSRERYKPPSEWFMINGMMDGLVQKVRPLVENDPQSLTARLLKSTTIINDVEERFGAKSRRGWEHLLERDAEDMDEEPWDAEIQDAYETTLSYIGGAAAAIRNTDAHLDDAGRRLILFPVFVKKSFVRLVEEQQPRAMVMLAHYFALLIFQEHLWWVGPVGREEARCIVDRLTGKWRDRVGWVIQRIDGSIPNEPTVAQHHQEVFA